MKKIVALILALIMVCAMGLTALADSPDTGNTGNEIQDKLEESQKDSVDSQVQDAVKVADKVTASETVTVGDEEVTTTVSAVETVPSNATTDIVAAVAEEISNGTIAVEAEDAKISVAAMFELTLSKEGEEFVIPEGQSATVTFTLEEEIPAGAAVLVVHWKSDGTVEVLDGAADGKNVTATFTSLSPIAIIVVTGAETETEQPSTPAQPAPAPSEDNNTNDATTAPAETTQPTSPDTADMNMMPVVLFAAVAFAAFIVMEKKARSL